MKVLKPEEKEKHLESSWVGMGVERHRIKYRLHITEEQ